MRFKRRQWSARAAMRKREVIQPRKIDSTEADTFLSVAGSNTGSVSENTVGFAGVRERGECTK